MGRQTWTVAIAIGIGVVAGIVGWLLTSRGAVVGADFAWVHRAAKLLLAGQNPYNDPAPISGLELYYPLPAVMLAVPLVVFSPAVAAGIFLGISCGLLALGVLRNGAHLWPLFLSMPFVLSLALAQWGPMLLACTLLPALRPLVLCKPTVGLPLLAMRSRRYDLVGSALIIGLSLLILPTWPLDMAHNISQRANVIPLLVMPGPLLLAALVRWRVGEARLLLGLSILPMRYYDPLALWLIPASVRTSLLLAISGWAALLGNFAIPGFGFGWIIVGMYLPALGFVLTMSRQRTPEQRPQVPEHFDTA